ncbi:MAG: SDR family oxidoreductase [Armatimonadetes bacterium]|nr:SDR family oxidoreductase [Armatimonadota bacterium]
MIEKVLPGLADPGRYIEKVSLMTGEVIDDSILPEHLLVQKHRDYHVLDVYARSLMSWFVKHTGDEGKVRQAMKDMRKFGQRASEILAKAVGQDDPEKISKALFGLKQREYYFRYKRNPYTAEEIAARIGELKAQAARQMERVRGEGRLQLRVLLTGGTGFVGKEILWQAATDPDIQEMIVLIRPRTIKDRETGKVLETHSPEQRGQALLRELRLDDSELHSKFRFMAGDIEAPRLGVSEQDFDELRSTLTHVVHCAASVAFDDPYDESFRANVEGSLNALEFSRGLQSASGSPFVAHLSIETSYIHGRQVIEQAREDEVVFPRNFYNNYYELTKAMASIETERYMLEKGLRVVQLCPAIVIGDSRAGNNRGDLKVVNAPVNAFGRAREALKETRGRWVDWSKTWVLSRMATTWPGDPSAELNLIPVDWVVKGILAAVKRERAVGERIHLATDNRITAEQIQRVMREELKVRVKLAEPTIHRNVQLPMLTKVLKSMHQDKLAGALQKLGTIFGGYAEWGQPVHRVGNDVDILGLPDHRPNTEHAFRMLCRHNKYVQQFGKVRDPEEISRRERIWSEFVTDVETRLEGPVGGMDPEHFRQALFSAIDLEKFEFRE